jgi:hypothetical protein
MFAAVICCAARQIVVLDAGAQNTMIALHTATPARVGWSTFVSSIAERATAFFGFGSLSRLQKSSPMVETSIHSRASQSQRIGWGFK